MNEEHRRRNTRSKYDDLDDRLHDIHRVDPGEPFFQWPRRSRLIPLIALVGLYVLYLTTWPRNTTVDWSRFAYVQYATDDRNICNAFMVFEALKRAGSKAERVLLYNAQFAPESSGAGDRSAQLLTRAEKLYNVKLKPVRLIDSRGELAKIPAGQDPSSWDHSITKLRAFELTEYERVIVLDSDIVLLDNVDELFLLPKAPMALPRAYWTDGPAARWPLSTSLMVLEPNPAEMKGLLDTLQAWRMDPEQHYGEDHDQEVINHRFGASSIVIPHRPYLLQTSEFRRHSHGNYLGNINGPAGHLAHWDAKKALAEAKIVHFDDWPLPKPWIMWPHDAVQEMQPDCEMSGEFQYSCKEREIWKDLYSDFRKRRKDLCRILSIPAPDWANWKKSVGASEEHIGPLP